MLFLKLVVNFRGSKEKATQDEHLPPEFLKGKRKKVKLLKTLYGLMQGGRYWFWTFNKAYKELGF